DRPLFDRLDRPPGHPIENIRECLLGDLGNGLDPAAIHRDVHQVWRRRNVPVPDAMMNELVVPHSFAGFGVKTHQALPEKAITGPMAAIQIIGRRLDRQVHVPEILVRGHRTPDTRLSRVAPGFVLPGVVTELARPWDGVEDPDALAAPRVKAAHMARLAFLSRS